MPEPFAVECPKCHATLKLKNASAVGRKVPCPKCKEPFVIELPDTDDEFAEGDDEFGDESGADVDDDFGDDDDWGGDDFGEPEDEPKPASTSTSTPKPKPKSSKAKWWIIGGSIASVLVIAGVVLAIFLPGSSQPQQAAKPRVVQQAAVETEEAEAEVEDTKLDLHWLPPDAELVVVIQVAKVTKAPLVVQLQADQLLGVVIKQGLDQVKQQLGFGVDEIDQVAVGITVPESAKQAGLQVSLDSLANLADEALAATVVLRLNKPLTAKVLTTALGTRAQLVKHQDKTYYRLAGQPDALLEGWLYLAPDGKYLVASSNEAFIKQVVAGGDPYKPRPELAFVDSESELVVALAKPGGGPLTTPSSAQPAAQPAASSTAQSTVQQSNLERQIEQAGSKLDGKITGLALGVSLSGESSSRIPAWRSSSDRSKHCSPRPRSPGRATPASSWPPRSARVARSRWSASYRCCCR